MDVLPLKSDAVVRDEKKKAVEGPASETGGSFDLEAQLFKKGKLDEGAAVVLLKTPDAAARTRVIRVLISKVGVTTTRRLLKVAALPEKMADDVDRSDALAKYGITSPDAIKAFVEVQPVIAKYYPSTDKQAMLWARVGDAEKLKALLLMVPGAPDWGADNVAELWGLVRDLDVLRRSIQATAYDWCNWTATRGVWTKFLAATGTKATKSTRAMDVVLAGARFQKSAGLPVTGFIDDATLARAPGPEKLKLPSTATELKEVKVETGKDGGGVFDIAPVLSRPVPKALDAEITALMRSLGENVSQTGIGISWKELEQPDVQNAEQGFYKKYRELDEATRARLRDRIRELRARIAALTAASTGVRAEELADVQAYFYMKMNRLSPYYTQMANLDILPSGSSEAWEHTCNITSFTMTMENLGRTKADFTGNLSLSFGKVAAADTASFLDPQATIRDIFRIVKEARKDDSDFQRYARVEDLRGPDHMQLVVIYRQLVRAFQRQVSSDAASLATNLKSYRDSGSAIESKTREKELVQANPGLKPAQKEKKLKTLSAEIEKAVKTQATAKDIVTKLLTGAGLKAPDLATAVEGDVLPRYLAARWTPFYKKTFVDAPMQFVRTNSSVIYSEIEYFRDLARMHGVTFEDRSLRINGKSEGDVRATMIRELGSDRIKTQMSDLESAIARMRATYSGDDLIARLKTDIRAVLSEMSAVAGELRTLEAADPKSRAMQYCAGVRKSLADLGLFKLLDRSASPLSPKTLQAFTDADKLKGHYAGVAGGIPGMRARLGELDPKKVGTIFSDADAAGAPARLPAERIEKVKAELERLSMPRTLSKFKTLVANLSLKPSVSKDRGVAAEAASLAARAAKIDPQLAAVGSALVDEQQLVPTELASALQRPGADPVKANKGVVAASVQRLAAALKKGAPDLDAEAKALDSSMAAVDAATRGVSVAGVRAELDAMSSVNLLDELERRFAPDPGATAPRKEGEGGAPGPLDTYRKAAMEQVYPDLKAGRSVFILRHGHYVRLQYMSTDGGIEIDDPAMKGANATVPWEEAYSFMYFSNYFVMGAEKKS